MTQVYVSSILFAIGEEAGWRGVLLPALLDKKRPFTASILLGAIWSVWHLPILYFSVFDSIVQFASFLAGYVPVLLIWSFIFTWVYERTDRNIWIVTLLHGSFTATYQIFEPILGRIGAFGVLLPLCSGLLFVCCLLISGRSYWFGKPAYSKKD
ncbi:CPBP family intramembrane glutamic endopeptidase [Paenibacillus chartarius]|uniref:CPBP family intramembrane glutamic endopeptidase n=1 Tax=Paenibacillus chartarius TaxID=747481 RepID=A0ABV6DE18_9BACL